MFPSALTSRFNLLQPMARLSEEPVATVEAICHWHLRRLLWMRSNIKGTMQQVSRAWGGAAALVACRRRCALSCQATTRGLTRKGHARWS